jgi:hypothetical protein
LRKERLPAKRIGTAAVGSSLRQPTGATVNGPATLDKEARHRLDANAAKPSEYGDASREPAAGVVVEATDPSAMGSTLT